MATKRTKKPRRKRSPKQCAAELAIEKRREKACKLRLAGWSIRDIAAHLQCAASTVHDDIATVLERTKDASATAVEKSKALSLARLDVATKGIWPAVESGELDAVDRLVRIEARRAKIEGFDAADKHEVSGPGGAPIPVESRSALDAKLDDLRKKLLGEVTGAAGAPEPGGDAGAQPDPSG